LGSGSFPSREEEDLFEESFWKEFEKYVLTATNPITSPFPSRVKTWANLNPGQAQPSKLTAQQFQDLQEGNGHTYVFFGSVIVYKDSLGEHELDYCSFTFNKQDVRYCRHHNGPAEPLPHNGFSFPRKWWIF
jgi:hypothetical protein